MRTIGIIGIGNMGGALLAGFARKLDRNEWQLAAFNRSRDKLDSLAEYGAAIMPDTQALAEVSDFIILAVKPQQIEGVFSTISPVAASKTVISIAAGVRLAALRNLAGPACSLCRCMPTTTAMAGHGIFALCFNGTDENSEAAVGHLFEKLGLYILLSEDRFAQFSAFMGAGPAYVFACMQGLAQAGLTLGFSQAECRRMLIELFIGAGELAKLQSGNFAQLRDNVCSPAGLTIAGINTLDRAGLTGLMVDAVEAAARRAREMEG